MTSRLPPLADVLDHVPDAVCVVNLEGIFLHVSASFRRILGYDPCEVLGKPAFDFVHPDDREITLRQAEQINAGVLQRHFRNRYIHKDGHSVDVQWSACLVPEYGVRIAVGHEVSELCQAERALEHLASHDVLTGLPNRHRLHIELRNAIKQAANGKAGPAVLYLDLDGFKAANDQHGHAAGDKVLQQVAQRIQQGVRRSDIVARMGGDEFIVVLPACPDLVTAQTIASGLMDRLSIPFNSQAEEIQLGVSVGIACYPDDGEDPEALLAHADRLMYQAKRGQQQYRKSG